MRIKPEIVHIVVLVEVITGVKPLVAVAVSVYGDCDGVRVVGVTNVMDCVAFATVIVLETTGAAE